MSITLTNTQSEFIDDLFRSAPFKADQRDDDAIVAAYVDLRANSHTLDTINLNDCIATALYFDELKEPVSISPFDNGHIRTIKICEICEIFSISINQIDIDEVKSTNAFLVINRSFPHDVYMSELAAYVLFFSEYRQSNPTHHKWVRWFYKTVRKPK